MLSKILSNDLQKLLLNSRQIHFNYRPILCFNSKRITLINLRNFCDKNERNIKKIGINSDLKVTERTDNRPDIVIARKLPKQKEFFYVFVQKPYELINWVKKTPREKKKNILFSGIIKWIKFLGYISTIWIIFYFAVVNENPLTGRECLYSVPPEMAAEIETDIFTEIFTKNVESGSFMPSSDPVVKRLDRCVDRIIESNKDLDLIGDGIWTPVVINDDKICDLIILKDSRNIFVYKKLMDLCETDDELAYVLCHQLSHLMLDHIREPIAYTSIIYLPFVMFLPKMWSINRDPSMHWFGKIDEFFEDQVKKFVRKTLTFSPYSDELEEEADRIAMQLMTRSCYDVRQCRQLCKRCKHLSETKNKGKDKNEGKDQNDHIDYHFFIKHPINDNKLLYLFQYIKPFMIIRNRCDCPPLDGKI